MSPKGWHRPLLVTSPSNPSRRPAAPPGLGGAIGAFFIRPLCVAPSPRKNPAPPSDSCCSSWPWWAPRSTTRPVTSPTSPRGAQGHPWGRPQFQRDPKFQLGTSTGRRRWHPWVAPAPCCRCRLLCRRLCRPLVAPGHAEGTPPSNWGRCPGLPRPPGLINEAVN